MQVYHCITHNNLFPSKPSVWTPGPVLLKSIFNNINSNYFYNSQKVLFTCAVTRAVNLEVVPNFTTSSFICALKRFISRKGILNLLISDNVTCFKNEEIRLSEELTRMAYPGKL